MEREPTAEERADVFNPELLPSPSDELSAEAAHSRGCASGNTLAPASRGITLPGPTSIVGASPNGNRKADKGRACDLDVYFPGWNPLMRLTISEDGKSLLEK